MIKAIIIAAAVSVIASAGACAYMHVRVRLSEKKAEDLAVQCEELSESLEKAVAENGRQKKAIDDIRSEIARIDAATNAFYTKQKNIILAHENDQREIEGVCADSPEWSDIPIPDGVRRHIEARAADNTCNRNNFVKASVNTIDAMHEGGRYADYD